MSSNTTTILNEDNTKVSTSTNDITNKVFDEEKTTITKNDINIKINDNNNDDDDEEKKVEGQSKSNQTTEHKSSSEQSINDNNNKFIPKCNIFEFIQRNKTRISVAFMFIIGLSILLGVVFAPKPTVRKYYIAAEDTLWDYAPDNQDTCSGSTFEYPATKYTSKHFGNLNYTKNFNNRIGLKYIKAKFVEYTDETFTTRKKRSEEWKHLGLLGPVIRAETGDQIQVVFRNNARFPFSISPNDGLQFTKSGEGKNYNDGTSWIKDLKDNGLKPFSLRQSTCLGFSTSRGVRPCQLYKVLNGEQYTYVWNVNEGALRGTNASSAAFMYTSSHDMEHDLNAGLMGPIIITKKGFAANPSSKNLNPNDVDREFVMVFHAVDENHSPYLSANIYANIIKPTMAKNAKPGYISFSYLDKPRVLQALVNYATSGTSKISYTKATELVDESIQSHKPVYIVEGRPIHIRFDQDSFNPLQYDEANGGHGSAKRVVQKLIETLIDKESSSFHESNVMHGVNGYIYCNQKGLKMYEGEKVRWYTIVVGSAMDIHTPHWHGNTVLVEGKRYDELDLIPGLSLSADMHATNKGKWLFHCHVNDHLQAGMTSLYEVSNRTAITSTSSSGIEREYFIAAEEVDWDYLPGGKDECGSYISSNNATTNWVLDKYFNNVNYASIGGRKVKKVRYIEYTDNTFSTKKIQPEHFGILGPVIRAVVGDNIKVHFKNRARFPFSIHPHGVFYGKDSEGANYNDGTTFVADGAVAPNKTYTYIWTVPEDAGPGPKDLSSKLWMYHSHVSETNDTNSGLIGPIVITRKNMATSRLRLWPKDIDQDVFLLFNVFDEKKSKYLKINVDENVMYIDGTVEGAGGTQKISKASMTTTAWQSAMKNLKHDPTFHRYSMKHTINGRALCTLKGLDGFKKGEKIRWNIFSIGDEIDLHVPTWKGHKVIDTSSQIRSNALLIPSSMKSVDTVMKPGNWPLVDFPENHNLLGARALFKVSGTEEIEMVTKEEAKTVRYFIAADEVEWDYAPEKRNNCKKESESAFSGEETVATEQGYQRIGTKYIKSIYREYKSEKFQFLRWGANSRFNPASAHLGLLGPVVKAAVGETIEIVFRNNLKAAVSLVPLSGPLVPLKEVEALNDKQRQFVAAGERRRLHGAHGGPDNFNHEEQTIYDGDRKPFEVCPGGEIKMTIPVTTDAGPLPDEDSGDGSSSSSNEQSSAIYLYGSDVDSVRDLNSGLIGTILIYNEKHAGRKDQLPKGIHREMITLFTTFDENLSRYIKMNALKYAKEGETINFLDPDFKESNRMRSINGFMYCNTPSPEIKQHKRVRWYQIVLGSSDAVHAPTISGLTSGAGSEMTIIGPGMTHIKDFTADNYGKWLLHDAVVDQTSQGMSMLVDITEVLHSGA